MFPNRPLARRPWRRRHNIGSAPGLDTVTEPRDPLEALCQWGRNMPWVAELPCAEPEPTLRRFVVDCAVIQLHEPWFAVDGAAESLQDGPLVLVAVPNTMARRGAALGWAVTVGELNGDRNIIAVAVPTTIAELTALQSLLGVAYAAAFDPLDRAT